MRSSGFFVHPVRSSLPWLMAFLVYLGALAVANVLIVQQMASGWDRGMGGSITVQLPSGGAGADDEVSSVLDMLRATPGVASAEPVSDDDVLALRAPWLDDLGRPQNVPRPRLIDVQLKPGVSIDASALQEQLEHQVPGALVDDRAHSLDMVRALTSTIQAMSAVFIASLALLATGIVLVVTRSGIGVHGDTLEVLHLLGVDERFLARELTIPVFKQALLGGLIGCAAAVASLLALERLTVDFLSGPLLALGLAPVHWVAVSAVPFLLAALTLIAARVAVYRSLAARA